MVSHNRLIHIIDCEWPSSSTSSFPKESVLFSFFSFTKIEVKGFESEVKYSPCSRVLKMYIKILCTWTKVKLKASFNGDGTRKFETSSLGSIWNSYQGTRFKAQ